MSTLPPHDVAAIFWIDASGQQQGPEPLTVVVERIAFGQIPESTPVWWQGVGNWGSFDSHAELRDLLAARNAPPAPAPAPAQVVTVPEAAPAPSFEAPAPTPVFETPAPAPTPTFEAPAPAPVFEAPAPAPVFEAPAPVAAAPTFEAPAPFEPTVAAPVVDAAAPSFATPAPAPFEAPAPAAEAPAPAPTFEAPAPAAEAPTPLFGAPAAAPLFGTPAPAPAAPAAEAPVFESPSFEAPAAVTNGVAPATNGAITTETLAPAAAEAPASFETAAAPAPLFGANAAMPAPAPAPAPTPAVEVPVVHVPEPAPAPAPTLSLGDPAHLASVFDTLSIRSAQHRNEAARAAAVDETLVGLVRRALEAIGFTIDEAATTEEYHSFRLTEPDGSGASLAIERVAAKPTVAATVEQPVTCFVDRRGRASVGLFVGDYLNDSGATEQGLFTEHLAAIVAAAS